MTEKLDRFLAEHVAVSRRFFLGASAANGLVAGAVGVRRGWFTPTALIALMTFFVCAPLRTATFFGATAFFARDFDVGFAAGPFAAVFESDTI